jgi:hypothetical protein
MDESTQSNFAQIVEFDRLLLGVMFEQDHFITIIRGASRK